MARKPRDYKAEYAAAKKRATAQGYKSVRQQKTTRRIAKQDSPAWSDAHSHTSRSAFDEEWGVSRKEKYWRTFVDPMPGLSKKARSKEKRRRLHEWLVPEWMDQAEWDSKYPPM